MRSLRQRTKPVDYAQANKGNVEDGGSDEEQDHHMRDDDSDGSAYDEKEGQDAAEEEDKGEDGSDFDATELEDRAVRSGEDDLMSEDGSKSARKGRGNGKGKKERWQEDPHFLERAVAIKKLPNVSVALEKQRAELPAGFMMDWPPLTAIPDVKTTSEFIAYGEQVMGQIKSLADIGYATEFNLHPIMSMLYSPWSTRPKFDDQRDTNGLIRSLWRKSEPTESEKAAHKKSKGADPTAKEMREETLAADKYDVKRTIPFLPDTIPLSEPSWRLATYTALGVTPDDLAHRVAMDDPELNDKLVCHKQLRNRLKKKIDDWLKAYHGGFQWLGDRQQTRARKVGQEQRHEFASAVLTGWKNSNITRKAVSELGYFFNTTWEIDIKLGVMKQPGGLGAAHPLWEPRELKDVPEQIKAWRKNVAKLHNLPELDDLLKELRGEDAAEGEVMVAGDVGEGEGMSGVEAGHGEDVPGAGAGQEEGMVGLEAEQAEGLSGEPEVRFDEEGRPAKRPRLK